MKHRTLLLGALTLTSLAAPAFCQETAVPATGKEPLSAEEPAALPEDVTVKSEAVVVPIEIPESVKNLTQDQKQRLQKLLNDASTYLSGIRVQEAFEKIIEAESITPDLFQLHNLKGAAYTKIRDFTKARVSFERALELSPGTFMSQFNLCELDFVEHKFADAEKSFKKLIADSPDMNLGTRRLIEFKILISLLLQEKDEAANAIQATFDFLEDTPAFYFGNAAIAFDADDEEEARDWIRSAERIYTQQEVSVYVDSFIEMGWIDNLQ